MKVLNVYNGGKTKTSECFKKIEHKLLKYEKQKHQKLSQISVIKQNCFLRTYYKAVR